MIEPGNPASDFALKDATGQIIHLRDFLGKRVVLYFYPEDDTPLCTNQACSLKDHYGAVQARNAVVLGISPDSVDSHRAFSAKFGLPFTLLADPEHQVMEAYGVWGEKSLYGHTVVGVRRWTYLIDEKGLVTKVIRKVNTAKHGEEVLKWL